MKAVPIDRAAADGINRDILMWHSFRIITLIISLAISFYRHFRGRFSGMPELHGKNKLYVQKKYDKSSLKLIRVGVEVSSSFRFDIRRESARDKTWKSLGLVHELSVGNDSFDDEYFIVTDDSRVEQCLRVDRGTLKSINRLLVSTSPSFQPTMLRCQRGFLWVESKCTGVDDRAAFHYASDIAEELSQIASQFSDFKFSSIRPVDFSFHRSAVPLVISSGLAVYGGINAFSVAMPNFPHLVNGGGFLLISAFIGLIVFVLLCLVARWLLVGSSRFHIVMLELFTVGIFGAMTSSAATLHQLNHELDTSSPRMVTAVLVKKETVTRIGRRGRRHTSYYFHFSRNLDLPPSRKYSVSHSEFKRTPTGQRYEFEVYEGAFGWSYVASKQRKDSLVQYND